MQHRAFASPPLTTCTCIHLPPRCVFHYVRTVPSCVFKEPACACFLLPLSLIGLALVPVVCVLGYVLAVLAGFLVAGPMCGAKVFDQRCLADA